MSRAGADDSRAPAAPSGEAALRRCLQDAADGLLVLDPDDRILLCNDRAGALLGVDPARIAGTALPELLAPESAGAGLNRHRPRRHWRWPATLGPGAWPTSP
ncbi:PAS domain-containing protein [Stenotrophomonas nitritireducens]|uniref:PAS domain-containing protein n=1 Tax=Stenotrophomonas nitritireducens TaxID=83617 RepID=UPI003D98FE10